jgi:hypothetical protein
MPTENEFRYVLHGDAADMARRVMGLPGAARMLVEQGDLAKGVRLRRTVAAGVTVLLLGYKKLVDGDKIEIETAVSPFDFDRLWATCELKHSKTRLAFVDGDRHWDVDVYGDVAAPYFMRAECEVPEHVVEAPAIHPVLEEFLLYTAGKEKGFSSRRVADPAYARRLMRTLADFAEGEAGLSLKVA